MEKPPKEVLLFESKEEIPTIDQKIPSLNIEEGDKPHIKIRKFVELNEEYEKLYVQIFDDVDKIKPQKELEAPTLEDALLTAYAQSKKYDLPLLSENINFNQN